MGKYKKKATAKLDRRIAGYKESATRKDGYRQPGSMKKAK